MKMYKEVLTAAKRRYECIDDQTMVTNIRMNHERAYLRLSNLRDEDSFGAEHCAP